MSIIIHFNASSFIPSSTISTPSHVSRARTKLAMVPGIDETDQTVMTDDESSMVDIATSNTLYTHSVNDLKNNNVLGSCFGLPYQDHNYGAPPPPTPPSYSPCTSPAHANGVPDEDANLSIMPTSIINEETQEGSITRCICGFEHDDEYMICCDLCLVWQHVDCMGLDRNNIPDTYLCEKCEPRKVDRHKAKVLQTRKKVAMTDSSDSEENTGFKYIKRKQKNRKRKRKEEISDEKTEQGLGKRSKHMHKYTKEKIDAKRSKLRHGKTTNKESTSTADEEAQDAWEISLEWCEKNFETAVNNQYTPEVQNLVKTVPIQGHVERFMELLLTRNCQVMAGNQKKLISIYDIPRDQPLIEYKGKFLLASQFYDLHPAFSKRLFPFVMFYALGQEEICVDASMYGNEARFIRKSCKPNAELRHLVHHGNLHLYISSTKAVFKDDEITLPLDLALKESIKDIECACESEECILKFHPKNGNADMSHDKKKKGRKLTFSADDDDSSHSFAGSNPSSTKCKPVRSHSQTSETTEGKSDHETEEQANERKKKTREERKIDAIMRAFDQMEKAAKRRQQVLERQKAHHPKLEDMSEKSENLSTSKEDDKVATASGSETQGGEEEKANVQTPKPKKGKRRRCSGTPSKRRTRTNSGGSDILSPEENVLPKNVPETNIDVVSSSDTVVETVVVATSCSTTDILSPVLPSLPISPVLKTKRFLLHEWLHEKSETNTNPSTTSPVSIRAEVKWNTSTPSSTCYVQCTKDNPHSGGISAAHLRRSSTSSQIKPFPLKSCSEQGFAKKRWLRQAMFDCSSYDESLTIDPGGIDGLHLENECLSPICHGELGSPGAVDDTITPLKKRRVIRESVESSSSPLSPTIQSSEYSSTDINSMSSQVNAETGLDDLDQQLLPSKTECLCSELSPESNEDVFFKINDLRVDHSQSSRKISIKEVNESNKEETSNCETSICTSLSSKCNTLETVSSSLSSNYKAVESSMQNNCDLENKVCEYVNECVQNSNLDITQSTCKTIKSSTTNVDVFSDLYFNEKIKSNYETEKNSSIEKSCTNFPFESTSECSSEKQKNRVSDNCNFQSNVTEDKCSSSLKCNYLFIANDSNVNPSETKEVSTSETDIDCTSFKFQEIHEDNVYKAVSENSLIQLVICENTQENSIDLISQCLKVNNSSVSPVKKVDNSVSVFLDYQNKQVDSDVSLHKKLTELSTANSEELCSNNFKSDDINTNMNSDLESKSLQLCNENSGLRKTTIISPQKRKVSLSEYRLRMKDGSNKHINSENVKKNKSSPATAIPECLPEQVTLAPLPLFDTTVRSKSPPQTPVVMKNPKNKTDAEVEEESYEEVTEHRENLTERLKREFGLDDDSESSTLSQSMSIAGSTSTLVLCAQPPPPPPPPPPPRSVRPSQSNISAVTAAPSTQFGFSMSTPYARPSYIVPQVPSVQFIPVQQIVNTPMPSVHPITTPGVQTTLLPSPHSFAPSPSGTVIQPSIQHEFSSINAQNFVALVQPSPPPPPPKSYPHVYQSGIYK